MNEGTRRRILRSLSTRLLAAALCAAAPVTAASAGEVESILEAARRAAGREGTDAGSCLRLAGRATLLGVEERFEADYAGDGRFRLGFLGELPREVRHDGRAVRLSECAPLWHELELFGREAEILRAWVHGGRWLDPDAPLSVERSAAAAPGIVALDLRLAGGRLDARVELDAEDHLVRALVLPTGGGVLRTEYADHRAVEGRRVAHRVRCELSPGSEYTLEVSTARLAQAEESVFSAVPDAPDFGFDPDVPPEVEVVRSSSKHLFVRPLVDGEDVGLFLFDTGAGFSGISVEAAERLGLRAFGSSSFTGLGGDVTTARMRRADELRLGPLVIEGLVFTEVPVGRKSELVGEKVAGVLGWDVMRRAVVDLEPQGVLRLYDPVTYELSMGAWEPLTLHYKVPYVRSSFVGGQEGLFMLDCGAAGMTVMFFHHAAAALGLLEEQDATPVSTGHGAGGAFQHRLDELDWFEFAGERLDDMTIIVSTAEDGEADPYSLGLIGGGLLRLYRLVFDYGNTRVAIVPL